MPKHKCSLQDPEVALFLDLLAVMPNDHAQLRDLAHDAKVSPQTLWNWKYGATLNPHIRTLTKVAHALGFRFQLTRPVAAKLRAVK